MQVIGETHARERILVVDDDRATRELIIAALEDKSLSVECAPDGQVALSMIEAEAFDAVVTDVNMPGMDGLTLLRRIREIRRGLPVVIITADDIPANVARSLRENAFAFIGKPFSCDVLTETIERALTGPSSADDIEVLSALPNWISLRVRCKLSTADRLLSFLREMISALGAEDRERIAAAFRELLMNAIEHGGHFDPDQRVHLSYIRTARSILYYLRDPGAGFATGDLPHAAVSNAPDRPLAHLEVRAARGIRPGGFGILLSRNVADELLYSERGNEVILIKHLDY